MQGGLYDFQFMINSLWLVVRRKSFDLSVIWDFTGAQTISAMLRVASVNASSFMRGQRTVAKQRVSCIFLPHAAAGHVPLSFGPVARTHASRASSSDSPVRQAATEAADMYADQNNTWVDRMVPASVAPYLKLARVDRPIGTSLLLWPGLWSIALAAPSGCLPDLTLMGLFGVGAFVMRGAGCTINDMWDRDIDSKVARTAQRPLASGAVSMPQAVAFLGGQLSLGLAVLTQLNSYSIALGAASLLPVALYPAAKRVTGWPQAVLGLTFNWGALLGWSAVHADLFLPAVLPLYAGCFAWTLVYDTIYAHQDKVDDAKLGLKSSALTLGDDASRPVLTGLTAAAAAAWALSGVALMDTPYAMGGAFWGGVAATSAHMMWQVRTAEWDNRQNLNDRFVSNQYAGALMLLGIVLGKLAMEKQNQDEERKSTREPCDAGAGQVGGMRR